MQRDYDGRLCFNHEEETLEMQVYEHLFVYMSAEDRVLCVHV